MVKKWLSALLSVLFAAGIIVSLLVFPNGAADVQSQIKLTNLTVTLNGITVYQDIPPTITTSTTGVAITDGSDLSFSLDWLVINPGSYTFQDGDHFSFPIMTTQGFASFPTASYPLVVGGVMVGNGVFQVTNNADSSASLSFVVTFNANAASKTIQGGYANGDATVTLLQNGGGAYIEFEDSGTYTYFDQYTPPGGGGGTGGGGDTAPVDPPTWQDVPPYTFPPTHGVQKFAIEPNIVNNYAVPPTIGSSSYIWPALPARSYNGALGAAAPGASFPGFQWYAAFTGLEQQYEQNPTCGPSDNIVLADTISGNMAFSNYQTNYYTAGGGNADYGYMYSAFYTDLNNQSGTAYGDNLPGIVAPAITTGKGIQNDFFSVPMLEKPFGVDAAGNAIATVRFDTGSAIYAPQSQFTQICDSAADPAYNIYSSPAMTVAAVNVANGKSYANAADAVNGTPMSYTVVHNADGTSTLLVNIGKIGNGVPAGQGIQYSDLYFAGGSLTGANKAGLVTFIDYYILNGQGSGFAGYQKKVSDIVNNLNTPYTTIMANLALLNNDFASYAPGGAKAALFSTQTTVQDSNGNSYTVGYPDATSYAAAYNLAKTALTQYIADAQTYMQGGNQAVSYGAWPNNQKLLYGNGPYSNVYGDLLFFLDKVQMYDSVNGNIIKGTSLSTSTNATLYNNIVNTFNIINAVDNTGLVKYSADMAALPSTLAQLRAARDSTIKAALFIMPQLRTFFAEQFGLDVNALDVNHDGWLDPTELSDDALIVAMIDNDSVGRAVALMTKPADVGGTAYNAATHSFNGVALGAFGFGDSWDTASGILAWIADGHAINQFQTTGVSAFQTNGVGLMYRSIMTNTANTTITNDIKVTVGDDNYNDQITYTYAYGAGIYAIDKGGAAFVKADANVYGQTGWQPLTFANFQNTAGLQGAAFSVYASQGDANAGTNPLKFTAGSDGNSYTYDTSGSVTEITTGSSGNFVLLGFPDAGATYWIKEVGAPGGYYSNSAPYAFTVTVSGTTPACYALYDTPNTASVVISGTKAVAGANAPNETFNFTLTQVADGTGKDYTAGTPITRAASITGSGEFTFPVIDNLAVGTTYYFKVTETPGSAVGWKYDGSVYLVKVAVAADGSTTVTSAANTGLNTWPPESEWSIVGANTAIACTATPRTIDLTPVPFVYNGSETYKRNTNISMPSYYDSSTTWISNDTSANPAEKLLAMCAEQDIGTLPVFGASMIWSASRDNMASALAFALASQTLSGLSAADFDRFLALSSGYDAGTGNTNRSNLMQTVLWLYEFSYRYTIPANLMPPASLTSQPDWWKYFPGGLYNEITTYNRDAFIQATNMINEMMAQYAQGKTTSLNMTFTPTAANAGTLSFTHDGFVPHNASGEQYDLHLSWTQPSGTVTVLKNGTAISSGDPVAETDTITVSYTGMAPTFTLVDNGKYLKAGSIQGDLLQVNPSSTAVQKLIVGHAEFVTLECDLTLSSGSGVMFTNIYASPTHNFSFTKIDGSGAVLTGANFALYAGTTITGLPFQSATSDENGLVSFTDLTQGDYVLTETSTLPGYQLPAGYWMVNIGDDGTIAITAQGSGTIPAFRLTDGTYYLPNYPKIKLPASGTDITILFTTGGAVLLCTAAGLWLAGCRRKKTAVPR